MRRGWLIWALGILVALGVVGALLVAVGRDDDSGARDLGAPREGGTLRVAVVNLGSLDPAGARDESALMVADQLFDTLVTYNSETSVAEAGIAASWQASLDQRRFTFTLREGLTFHDGSALTSEDVKASLDRIAAPGSESERRFLLQTVVGYPEFNQARTSDNLTGVKVVNERELTIELSEPFADFPLVLGNPSFGIVPTERAGELVFGDEPIGSGPMKYAGRDGDVILLVRSDGYAPRATYVDEIELHLMDDADAAFEALREDRVDVAPVPADQVEEAQDTYGEDGFEPFLGMLFYGMNADTPAFADPRMRQAVVHAVDRERIVDVIYGRTVILAQGFVPAGVPGAVDDACGDRCRHDPDRARQLVREVFPNGDVPPVSIDFDEDPQQRAVAAAIQSDLRAAGIPADLRPHEFRDYPVFLVNEELQLFRFGWIADYPSADGFLFPVFVSNQRDNLVRFNNREADQKLREARAEPDPARRASLYQQAEQMILDQVPMVPIAQYTNRWAAGPDVGGFRMTPLGTFPVTDVFLARASGSGA